MLEILILGSAAGGGFPQWNCNCDLCQRARAEDPDVKQRTQSSLAVSSGDGKWFLLNASPDLRKQINDNPQLHPKKGLRDSPISGVVLTNADIDHIAGLLNLRESQPLTIYATPRVHSVLASNSVYQVLNPDFVERRDLSLGETTTLSSKDGISNGLSVEPIAVPGKVALFLEDPTKENFGSVPEDTVALRITETATGNFFYYLPGCASMPSELSKLLRGAPLVFVDGTVWEDEEMITTKTGVKTGQRMGHMHLNGDDGTITAFSGLEIGRKILIHINNTNPVLDDASPERKLTEAAGWEVGFDGMRVTL